MTATRITAPPVTLRRARPALGTLVDIRIEAASDECARQAIAAAFAEIDVVHRLMSFHDDASDLSRLNRSTRGERLRVDARTAEVLRFAEQLRLDSHGAFDCAVADALVAQGSLPEPSSRHPDDDPGFSEVGDTEVVGVEVIRGARRLDLGGVAKGYAVDRAVELLRSLGASAAVVDAGGDLRHFGAIPARVHLRDPADPSSIVAAFDLRDAALASSATNGLAGPSPPPARIPSTLIDGRGPRGARPLAGGAGASVMAPTCMLADALTKVVLVTGEREHPLLDRHGATLVLHRFAAS